MPHTTATIFADMLSLLKELEWTGFMPGSDDRCCPKCGESPIPEELHLPGCHLQATIALAEEQVRKDGELNL